MSGIIYNYREQMSEFVDKLNYIEECASSPLRKDTVIGLLRDLAKVVDDELRELQSRVADIEKGEGK